MDHETLVRELLLNEYAEAGQVTRRHEQLTRTSVSVLLPTLLALAGFVVGPVSTGTKVVLAIGGLAVSLLVLNIVRRHQLYYLSYIKHAHAIEEAVKVQDAQVIKLYTLGKGATKGSLTISNKTGFSALAIIAGVFFLASAVVYGYQIFSAVWP